MSVYVGASEWPFGRMMMAHMTADSTEELLEMADKVGVARKWLQYAGTYREHFDICKSKRTLAIRNGAISIDHADEAMKLSVKREQHAKKNGVSRKSLQRSPHNEHTHR